MKTSELPDGREISLISDADKKVCPSCYQLAVVPLTPKQLAAQPDATTHVCHPALGGCNQGFELTAPETAPETKLTRRDFDVITVKNSKKLRVRSNNRGGKYGQVCRDGDGKIISFDSEEAAEAFIAERIR